MPSVKALNTVLAVITFPIVYLLAALALVAVLIFSKEARSMFFK